MATIGILDSGVGGLSVARAIVDRLPGVSLIYFADTANFPYGERSPAEVSALAAHAIRRLAGLGVICVVVACNTASASVLAGERAVGVPLFEILSSATLGRTLRGWAGARLGLIATPLTVASRSYHELVAHFARPRAFAVLPAPRLVRLVEAGQDDLPGALDVVRVELAPLARERLDALILGCTHFGFLAEAIGAVLGPSVHLIDPSRLVAEAVAYALTTAGLAGVPPAPADRRHRLIVTGGQARRTIAAATRLGLSFEWIHFGDASARDGAPCEPAPGRPVGASCRE